MMQQYRPAAATRFVIVSALLATGGAAWGGAPGNDDCAGRKTIGLGSTLIDTNGATDGVDNPCGMGSDVWFSFTSTFNGEVVASMCGMANFDTVLAAYDGCNCGSLVEIICNDNGPGGCGLASELVFPVEPGKCYLIRVGGFLGETGTGTLHLRVADGNNAANADRIRSGVKAGDAFGKALSTAGDNNGDGRAEVLFGAPLNDRKATNAGQINAFRGPALSGGHTINGAKAKDQFGHAVAGGFDLNNDGKADFVIGAPYNDDKAADAGKVYAYSGANKSLLWSRTGQRKADWFGFSVAIIGDVNGDGRPDVLVGAPRYDGSASNTGRAYVLNGKNGAVLHTVNGSKKGDNFGYSVAGIGDLDGDGRPDFAVGAPYSDAGGVDAGRVAVYSGRNKAILQRITGQAAGDRLGWSVAGRTYDVGGEHFTVLLAGAPFHDAAGVDSGRVSVFYQDHNDPDGCLLCPWIDHDGQAAGDRFGHSVAMGDVVGDGRAGFLVGAPFNDGNGVNAGRVYLFDSDAVFAAAFSGEADGDNFGWSVAIAGDVDNDGRNDVVFGSPGNDAVFNNGGRAYLFYLPLNDAVAASSSVSGGAGRHLNGIPLRERLDTEALARLIEVWGPCDGCGWDLNADGVVDGGDMAILLQNWGMPFHRP